MTVRGRERAVVSVVFNEKLRESKVIAPSWLLSVYFLRYSNQDQGRMIPTYSSFPARELPCVAFQDHKQSQWGWLHYVLVPCWSLFIDCMSKQFQCLLPVQDAALFHLLRLQDTFLWYFKNKLLPLLMCGFCCCCCFCHSFVIFTKDSSWWKCLQGSDAYPWQVRGSFSSGTFLQDSSGTPLCTVRPIATVLSGTSVHLFLIGPQIPQHSTPFSNPSHLPG